jgi:Tannase and feruloyl esterase
MIIQPFTKHAAVFLLAVASSLVLSAQTAKTNASTGQPLDLPSVGHAIECPALTSVDVSQAVGAPTVVTSATVVDDGKLAAYCKLQIVVDDYAKFELHFPVSAWTQRLLFGGGPGAQVAPGGMKLDQFVTASWQDLGHRGHEDDLATNYQYRVNAAYRGMHLQVLAAKALIARYYGQAPKFSYYNACSEPGREGMMEVQRFPEDFDGVGAGCPPINFTINNGVFQAWNVLTNTGADGNPILTADKLPILHKAILDQCAADGLKDGIISDPFSCHPNATAVECKPGQDPDTCLTSAQVHVAQELYKGAHDAQGGKLAPSGVLPGSELAWTATIVPNAAHNPTEARDQTTTAIRSQFSDPALPSTWELGDLKFDRASFDAITKLHYLYDATNPDLTAFARAGHKLILWQALGDTNVLPPQAILYYTALQKQMGAKTVDGFARFYVLPGVYHCGGGDGPVIRDLLAPLMLWVERGVAPGVLAGVHIPRPPRWANGGPGGPPAGPGPGPQMPASPPAVVDLTRPIYPYPYIAKYIGTGSITDAANFVQGPARPAPADLSDWFGSNFYTADYQKWCTGVGASFQCKDSR